MRGRYLTFDDRKRFEALWSEGYTATAIADDLKISTATVYMELHRGETGKLDRRGRTIYSAERGQAAFYAGMRRCGKRGKAKPAGTRTEDTA